tara:strand:+ start:195 stop:389 length:195 start_codon:yes stop_codon:yes gene_type:complete
VNNVTAVNASEEQSRALAEESRETTWKGRSFLRSLFLGKLKVDWIHPLPDTAESNEFKRVYSEL